MFSVKPHRVLLAALLLTVLPATALGAVPKLPTFDGPPIKGKDPIARPREIVYTGDGSGFLAGKGGPNQHRRFGHLHWTSWNGEEARGWGGNWVDNCNPDCASGTFSSYAVNLLAFRPRRIAGYLVFTRMSVTYTGHRPSFVHKRKATWTVSHTSGSFFWNF